MKRTLLVLWLTAFVISACVPALVPTPTATAVPTSTPTLTPIPTPTETPTPTPTETPTPIILTQTELTPDIAQELFPSEETLNNFQGDIFLLRYNHERGVTINLTVVVTPPAKESLKKEEWIEALNSLLSSTEFAFKLHREGKHIVYITLTELGTTQIVFFKTPESIHNQTGVADKIGCVFTQQSDGSYKREEIPRLRNLEHTKQRLDFDMVERDKWYIYHWNENLGTLIAHDDYQMQGILERDQNGKLIWRRISPEELIKDEFQILTPTERINKIISQYYEKTYHLDHRLMKGAKSYEILYDNNNEPAVILLIGEENIEEENGIKPHQRGVPPTSAMSIRKAWERIKQLDPEMIRVLTRVYGLKVIGGDLSLSLNPSDFYFPENTYRGEKYAATYTEGTIAINEATTKYYCDYACFLFLIVIEARAAAHDYGVLINAPMADNSPPDTPIWGKVFNENPGFDKTAFFELWMKSVPISSSERLYFEMHIRVVRESYMPP